MQWWATYMAHGLDPGSGGQPIRLMVPMVGTYMAHVLDPGSGGQPI